MSEPQATNPGPLADQPVESPAESDAGWSDAYTIRTFRDADAEACRTLYTAGILGGQLAENDTGLDIDDIPMAYLQGGLNHFWVAEVAPGQGERVGAPDGTVIGMIGVQHHDEGIGEIRRLRVADPHRRRRVGSRLLDIAVRFCREKGCLKVALDTFIERSAAVSLFEKHRFRHGRTRQTQGKDTLYFYLDFYASEER
ncbi:MAG: GNAT family N-acetyltransferase [Planctomycetota bacterium]